MLFLESIFPSCPARLLDFCLSTFVITHKDVQCTLYIIVAEFIDPLRKLKAAYSQLKVGLKGGMTHNTPPQPHSKLALTLP
jgi:hypothetical protein